jgi:integrase
MRQAEILSLKWTDVDRRSGFIRVREAKSGEGRDVPMDNTVLSLLGSIPPRVDTDFIFARENGQPLRGDSVSRAFKRACREAGISDFRFHDLRHHAASYLAMAGVDIKTIQEILGHRTLAMTMRYAHLSPDHKLRAIRVLDRQMDAFADTPPEGRAGSEKARIG